MRTRSLRRTALILCAVFALAVLAAIGLQVAHAGHHYLDGRCPLCVAYTGSQIILRILGMAAAIRALQLSKRSAHLLPCAPEVPILLSASPVSLGIRMND